MKLILESTAKTVVFNNGLPVRIWQGATESGVPVVAYIAFVMPEISPDDPRQAEFVAELERHAPPRPVVEAIPLRMFI